MILGDVPGDLARKQTREYYEMASKMIQSEAGKKLLLRKIDGLASKFEGI
jgi:hypothetical protein